MVRPFAAVLALLTLFAIGSWVAPAVADNGRLFSALPPSDAVQPDDDAESDEPEDADDDESDSDEADEAQADESEDDASEDDAADDDESDEDSDDESDDETEGEADASTAEEESDDEADAEPAADDEEKADDSADEEEPKEEDAEPETHTVETQDLTIEVEVDGVFVATEMEEVALRPKAWSTFKVERAVAHGARVRQGEELVLFDDEDLEEAIEERSLQQRVSEIALMEAEEEFPRSEQSVELAYESAERAYDEARDEYQRFEDTMRELSEELADYYLKTARQDLDNAREELEQLLQMYEADELTEETEEIVLRRQRFQVEVAEFSLEYTQINRDYTIDVAIPQREVLLKTMVEQARLNFERAKMARTLGLSRARYELQALRDERTRSVEAHGELTADRSLMRLRSPCDGIVYYGRCVNGRWMEVGSLETKLIPFGVVSPNAVLMTVVERWPMFVETSIGESELPQVRDEQDATIAPAADGEVEMHATVERVGSVPGSGNKFVVRLELTDEDEAPEWLMPGMTCKAKIVVYEAEDAVVIPAELVQTDEDDDDEKYVMVLVDDEPVRREVKLGKTKDKDVEVLDGLEADDKIIKDAKDEEEANDDEE
jgi:HlyD family secretion protein